MNSIPSYMVAALLAKLPRPSLPTVTLQPSVGLEIQVGDSINFASGAASGFPIPVVSTTTLVGATPETSGYVAQPGDVGQAASISQNFTSSGVTVHAQAQVTIIPKQTAWGLKLLGGNVGASASYSSNWFTNNVLIGGGTYVDYGQANGSGYHGTVDANGFPSSGSTWYISSSIGTLDGQIAASVDGSGNPLLAGDGTTGPLSAYTVYYTSPVTNVSTDVSVPQGGSIVANSWQSLGNNQYSFKVTKPQGGGVFSISFAHGVSWADMPRNGITPTQTTGEFYPGNLANAAQFTSIRLMDLCNVNTTTESLWSQRVVDYGAFSGSSSYAWERIARYINAVYSYPGSVCQTFWINIPVRAADSYVTSLVTLMQSLLLPGVHLIVEYANEIWNTGTAANPNTYTKDAAFSEAWVLLNYAGTTGSSGGITPNSITSITATGGVATVTLANNINTYLNPAGTPYVTNGAPCYAVDQTNANWSGGSGGVTTPISGPQLQVAITTGGSLAANQFSYPCGSATGTMTATDQIAFVFNVNSTLVTDQSSWNMFNLYQKFQTRRTYQIAALWKAVRPTDEITLGLQEYGGTGAGSLNSGISAHWAYGNWLGNGSITDTAGLKTWLDCACIAPYVFAQCNHASYTSGTNVIHNVGWAAYAQPGDTVAVGNLGTTVMNTTVVSGSGTDLTVFDTFSSSATGTAQVTYGAAAQVTGYISGNVFTVLSFVNSAQQPGTSICDGAVLWGNSSLVAGTTITSFGTGTGKTGTYNVNNSQNLGSAGSPGTFNVGTCDTVALMNAYLLGGIAEAQVSIRNHAYQCSKYGVKADGYEGGPDTKYCFLKMVELWTYGQNGVPASPSITMGTLITTLLDTWFGMGCNRWHQYLISPQWKSDVTNALSANYAINQTFGDQTPAYQALTAYTTRQLNYNRVTNSVPGTIQCNTYTFSAPSTATGLQTSGNASGMVYPTTNAAAWQFDVGFSVNRSGRFKLTNIVCSASAATSVDVYLDQTKIGTIVPPINGSAAVSTTTPGNATSADILIPTLLHGFHSISFHTAAGVAGTPGVRQFDLVVY